MYFALIECFSYVLCKQEMTENSPLGDLLRGSVDVSSCQIGKQPLRFLFDLTLYLSPGVVVLAAGHNFLIKKKKCQSLNLLVYGSLALSYLINGNIK